MTRLSYKACMVLTCTILCDLPELSLTNYSGK